MVKILLACSSGMSTSLLVNKMKKIAVENNLEVDITAVPECLAQNHFENLSILLLGPQIKHLEEKMKIASKDKFPVITIDTQKYGKMDGLGVLKDVIKAIKEFKNK
ncbi:MAG: PTS sugar transporter subunit IIB [Cetobacterium sp.]